MLKIRTALLQLDCSYVQMVFLKQLFNFQMKAMEQTAMLALKKTAMTTMTTRKRGSHHLIVLDAADGAAKSSCYQGVGL